MTQATITVTADTSTIRRILSILEGEARNKAGLTEDELHNFVRSLSLSSNCQEVVRTIAVFSNRGESISRAALRRLLVFEGDRTPDDTQLNGVIGTIGKRWKEFASGENPFVGRRNSADQDWACRIDAGLAERLVRELQDQAHRWPAQLSDSQTLRG
jgi:hypothetical protein